MRHALTQFPNCKYIWYLEQDALIMDPTRELGRDIMDEGSLDKLMIRDKPVVAPDSIIKTFSHLQPSEVQLVLTMDNSGMSPASLVVRNSDWADFFLDTWYDPIYKSYNFQKAEVHALVRRLHAPLPLSTPLTTMYRNTLSSGTRLFCPSWPLYPSAALTRTPLSTPANVMWTETSLCASPAARPKATRAVRGRPRRIWTNGGKRSPRRVREGIEDWGT
jgi:hypothetical protein